MGGSWTMFLAVQLNRMDTLLYFMVYPMQVSRARTRNLVVALTGLRCCIMMQPLVKSRTIEMVQYDKLPAGQVRRNRSASDNRQPVLKFRGWLREAHAVCAARHLPVGSSTATALIFAECDRCRDVVLWVRH